MIMGDFNAKVGKGRVENVAGGLGLGKMNERGDKLIQLVITNTF